MDFWSTENISVTGAAPYGDSEYGFLFPSSHNLNNTVVSVSGVLTENGRKISLFEDRTLFYNVTLEGELRVDNVDYVSLLNAQVSEELLIKNSALHFNL